MISNLRALAPCPVVQKLTQVGRPHAQDGYTLERVDVYGLIDGVHETVVIPGAECYVGRNDNPSFSSCRSFHLFHLYRRFTFLPSKFFLVCLKTLNASRLQLVRSRSARFRILSGVP
jgi:hypothetical protein